MIALFTNEKHYKNEKSDNQVLMVGQSGLDGRTIKIV